MKLHKQEAVLSSVEVVSERELLLQVLVLVQVVVGALLVLFGEVDVDDIVGAVLFHTLAENSALSDVAVHFSEHTLDSPNDEVTIFETIESTAGSFFGHDR